MWQPEDESLKMLAELLHESQVPNNAKQSEIHNKITELYANPEFSSYLVYILAISDNSNINVLRRIAGATLKGVIERHFDKISVQSLEYIKLKLMEAFNDPESQIRSSVTNAITALLTKIGFQNWPELMKFLILNLDVDHQEFLESSLECTYKILEDIKMNADQFDYQDEKYQNFIGELIPKLFNLCDPKLPPRIKAIALSSLNLFIFSMPQILIGNFGVYLEILMVLSVDQNFDVRQKSCEGFLELIETKKYMLNEYLQKIIEKLIQFTLDPEISIKKVACRFWNQYLSTEDDEAYERIEVLKNYLEVLVPALILCLKYTEEDLLNEEEDREEHSKLREGIFKESDEPLENDLYEEGFIADNPQGLWTLRREAGKTLEKISKRYREEVFLKAQEIIAESLRSNDWHIKESGILCLGALSEGSYGAIVPHLKDLFPFLMASLEDQHTLVRSISCWTLSKFTPWIIEQGRIDPQVIQAYLKKVLQKMMEENPKIQEASCSALCKIVYANPLLIEMHIGDIIEVLKYIYENYQKKGLTNLYDLIAVLAKKISPEKFHDEYLQNTILEILVKKWSDSHFNDRESIYLIECTDSIFALLGPISSAHSDFFVPKLLFLIVLYIQAKKNNEKRIFYNRKEIAVRSFDFLGTFLSKIGSQIQKYLSSEDYLKIFFECIQDPDLTIKRVTLASGGEIAKYCPLILQGRVDKIVQSYMDNLIVVPPEYDAEGLVDACCNNSAWAVGELALAYPDEFANYIPQFVNRICELFSSEEVKINYPLDQNLSIALGRLGLVNPDALAQHLEKFLKPFCEALIKIKSDPEKQGAFRGLFLAISKNPNGIVKDFVYLCDALVNFENAETDLQELALKLVINFKSVAGQYWDNYFVNFPKELQEKMKLKFGI